MNLRRYAAEVLFGLKEGEAVISGPTKQLAALHGGMAVKIKKGKP